MNDELEKLIRNNIHTFADEYLELDECVAAITDWHNKQIEAVLDRLSNQQEKLHWWTGGEYEKTTAVDMRAIEAERNKLKEAK